MSGEIVVNSQGQPLFWKNLVTDIFSGSPFASTGIDDSDCACGAHVPPRVCNRWSDKTSMAVSISGLTLAACDGASRSYVGSVDGTYDSLVDFNTFVSGRNGWKRSTIPVSVTSTIHGNTDCTGAFVASFSDFILELEVDISIEGAGFPNRYPAIWIGGNIKSHFNDPTGGGGAFSTTGSRGAGTPTTRHTFNCHWFNNITFPLTFLSGCFAGAVAPTVTVQI